LSDDGPLKNAAQSAMEDVEAVSNGMDRPATGRVRTETVDIPDPMFPWRILTDAVSAFSNGDTKTMIALAGSIPENSAPGKLKSVFEALSGRPPAGDQKDIITDRLPARSKELIDRP